MWDNYAAWGNIELWNNKRTEDYMMGTACIQDGDQYYFGQTCTMVPFMIPEVDENVVYNSPEDDEAPWWNPAFPESGRFAGIWVENIRGFETGGVRSVGSNPIATVVGDRKPLPKTITVTAWLHAKDCCALQYGYRWLDSKLRQKDCVTGKETSTLIMYDCCKELEEEESFLDYMRYMFKVSVASDLEEIQRTGTCCDDANCATNMQVQWTFALGNPKLYKSPDMCMNNQNWPGGTTSVVWDCTPCPEPLTEEVEVIREKTRYPVKVSSADGTYCPVGDWALSDYFDNPEEGYIEIVENDIISDPIRVQIAYDGTFSIPPFQRPLVDLTKINLCDVNFEVTHYAPGVYDVDPTLDAGATLIPVGSNHAEIEIPIKLVPLGAFGGTFAVANGGTFPQNFHRMGNIKIVVDNGCECESGTHECQLIFNPDGTYQPLFECVGAFPPPQCTRLTAYGQSAGDYITTEELPLENIFNGRPVSPIQLQDSYSALKPAYRQPLEWKQRCCKILFDSGVERAEPVFNFDAGSASLYNFGLDMYFLTDEDDICICDGDLTEEQINEWYCREPNFSIKAGREIPAGTKIAYVPFERKITATIYDEEYDATGMFSGKNGGSPFFVEFPECYGVCMVFTAQVRRDGSNAIISPAANATVSAGHMKFATVGI